MTRVTKVRVIAGVVMASLLLAALLSVVLMGCGTSETTTSSGESSTTFSSTTTSTAATTRVPKLTLVAPPGPMAIPMVYMATNNTMSTVADATEIVIWENPEQLKAIVAGGQGDFVTIPSNNSAIFYNKGLPVKLLDISVWNITYLITGDPEAASFSDIKGQSLVVSFKGSAPDVMFQYMAKKEGIDPAKDLELRYAADPTQAAQLLLAGEAKNAVLSEPLSTSVLLQGQQKGTPFYRALSFDEGWKSASGSAAATPIAGTVATASVMDDAAIVDEFLAQYQKAVEWMLANPDQAGALVEEKLPQLGFKAKPLTESLKNINWSFTPAADARPDLEAFFTALMELSPEVVGGTLPDDGFYYKPTTQ